MLDLSLELFANGLLQDESSTELDRLAVLARMRPDEALAAADELRRTAPRLFEIFGPTLEGTPKLEASTSPAKILYIAAVIVIAIVGQSLRSGCGP